MFPKILKLIIAVALICFSVYEFYENYIGNGIFLSLLSAFLILIYFKNEIIFLAFLRLRKQDFKGTEKWLNKIKNPESALVQKQQGYFHYLHGIIQSQKQSNHCRKIFQESYSIRPFYES